MCLSTQCRESNMIGRDDVSVEHTGYSPWYLFKSRDGCTACRCVEIPVYPSMRILVIQSWMKSRGCIYNPPTFEMAWFWVLTYASSFSGCETYASQTKILEDGTKDRSCDFDVLFKGVSTRFGRLIIEKCIVNERSIFCSVFQNIRLGRINFLLMFFPNVSTLSILA